MRTGIHVTIIGNTPTLATRRADADVYRLSALLYIFFKPSALPRWQSFAASLSLGSAGLIGGNRGDYMQCWR